MCVTFHFVIFYMLFNKITTLTIPSHIKTSSFMRKFVLKDMICMYFVATFEED